MSTPDRRPGTSWLDECVLSVDVVRLATGAATRMYSVLFLYSACTYIHSTRYCVALRPRDSCKCSCFPSSRTAVFRGHESASAVRQLS